MSLRNLCNVTTFAITRVVTTQTASGGNIRVYSTANRGLLITSITGRMTDMKASRREAYAQKDIELTHTFYSTTNPQVDERDRFELNGKLYWVHGQRNPDQLGIYYEVDCADFSRGTQ